jgi:uncharacterized membrane protein
MRRGYALIIIIPLFWLYRIVAVLCFHVWQGHVYEGLDMRADHLLMGCLLATILFQKSASPLWQLIGTRPWTLWITVSALALSSILPRLLQHAWRYRDTVGYVIDPILTAILIVQVFAFSQSSAVRIVHPEEGDNRVHTGAGRSGTLPPLKKRNRDQTPAAIALAVI